MSKSSIDHAGCHNSHPCLTTSTVTAGQQAAATITDSAGCPLQVQFNTPGSTGVVYYEKKSKFLTAKYDKQMRSLIQKRLGVEDFVYDQLRLLYGCVRDEDDHTCDIDLDKLLDIDSDFDRQKAIEAKIRSAVAPPDVVNNFVVTLLEKLKTL